MPKRNKAFNVLASVAKEGIEPLIFTYKPKVFVVRVHGASNEGDEIVVEEE
jgi:hypothetical protein